MQLHFLTLITHLSINIIRTEVSIALMHQILILLTWKEDITYQPVSGYRAVTSLPGVILLLRPVVSLTDAHRG